MLHGSPDSGGNFGLVTDLPPLFRDLRESHKGNLHADPAFAPCITDVNRCGRIDSEMSLDADPASVDTTGMTTPDAHLHFRRCDPSQNMARFYGLSLQPTLFGAVALVRAWGRIGSRGQERIEWHATEQEAKAALARHAARRLRHEYRPLRDP